MSERNHRLTGRIAIYYGAADTVVGLAFTQVDELEEQAQLRAQYLREFRANMEDTLRRVRVEQADGSYKPLVKKDKVN